MRTREKLTLEERIALALALIKRQHSLEEIRKQYGVSHTTAYKVRNAFLEGGRAALVGRRRTTTAGDLEARVSALEAAIKNNGERRRARRKTGRERGEGAGNQDASGARSGQK